ncbi:MAG TPA: DEAD/DEAH box helicase, partial [Candidatus Obscuribacterales bacterium]
MSIDLGNLFPFELDDFQLEAIGHLEEGRSVVVCAPTGSGKTVIAEYAVEMALARNERCFYTTPLKALSNQKFFDFRQKYGETGVGLLTGDISINREAPVVVMTTEVFRNML